MTNISVGTGPEIQMNGTGGRARENWVSEFEGFQVPAKNQNSGAIPRVSDPVVDRGTCNPAAIQRRTRSRATDSNKVMDNLRAEMKLLHWHKLANEAALKAALLKTKKIKAEGRGNVRQVPVPTTLAMPIAERAAWMQQILEEEQSKPLQVTKDFVSKYDAQEKENEGKIENEVAAHVRCLRDLREKIERREEMKLRRAHYRAAQKQLQGEKKQLLEGKISVCHDQHPPGERVGSAGVPTKGSHVRQRKVHDGHSKEGQEILYSEGALSTVLGSLNKLVELEKRVSSLEKRNVYDSCLRSSRTRKQGEIDSATKRTKASAEVPPPGAAAPALALGRGSRCAPPSHKAGITSLHPGRKRGPINFSKQRTEATPQGPSQVYYSVRVMNREVPGPRHGQQGCRRSRPRQETRVESSPVTRPTKTMPGTQKSRESSTFLTQLPDVHRGRRAERSGELRGGRDGGDSGCGCGWFPSSERTKRQRLEAMHRVARGDSDGTRVGRQGHMNQWMRRKKKFKSNRRISHVSSGMRSSRVTSNRKVPSGVSGVSDASLPPSRWSSLHLQEFNNLRAQYSKRTDKLRKDLSRRNQGSGTFITRGTRTRLTTRPRRVPVANASSHRVPAPNFRNTTAWGRNGRSAAEVSRGNTRRVVPSGTRSRRTRGKPGLAIGGKALSITRANSKPSSTTMAIGTAATTGIFPRSNRQQWEGRWAQRTDGPLPQVGVSGRDCLGGRSVARKASGKCR